MMDLDPDQMENIALGESDKEFVHDQLPSVEEYKTDQTNKLTYRNSKKLRLAAKIATAVVVAIILIVVAAAINDRNPTSPRLREVQHYIETSTGSGTVYHKDSPQHKAATWMALVDEKEIPFNDRFLTRYALMTFFYATGGDSTWLFDFNFGHPRRDECHWAHNFRAPDGTVVQMGVFCDPNNRVVEMKISELVIVFFLLLLLLLLLLLSSSCVFVCVHACLPCCLVRAILNTLCAMSALPITTHQFFCSSFPFSLLSFRRKRIDGRAPSRASTID